jgi:hypothetical protein
MSFKSAGQTKLLSFTWVVSRFKHAAEQRRQVITYNRGRLIWLFTVQIDAFVCSAPSPRLLCATRRHIDPWRNKAFPFNIRIYTRLRYNIMGSTGWFLVLQLSDSMLISHITHIPCFERRSGGAGSNSNQSLWNDCGIKYWIFVVYSFATGNSTKQFAPLYHWSKILFRKRANAEDHVAVFIYYRWFCAKSTMANR